MQAPAAASKWRSLETTEISTSTRKPIMQFTDPQVICLQKHPWVKFWPSTTENGIGNTLWTNRPKKCSKTRTCTSRKLTKPPDPQMVKRKGSMSRISWLIWLEIKMAPKLNSIWHVTIMTLTKIWQLHIFLSLRVTRPARRMDPD